MPYLDHPQHHANLAAIRLPLCFVLFFALVVLPLPYLYSLLDFLEDLFTRNKCLLPMR